MSRFADMSAGRVSADAFYNEYHGHKVEHLRPLLESLRGSGAQSFTYLVGDSTLDNKHWLLTHRNLQEEKSAAAAINGYERALDPQIMIKDVSYWINQECMRLRPDSRTPCINCAVEESCIVQREVGGLLPQDKFVRDNITQEDVLVVDMGGNDVALRPTCWLIVHMAWLLYLTPTCFIRWCGPLLAPGLWYFIYMFRVRLKRIIEKVTSKTKPKKIIVCMLYYLDETPGGSWADGTLKMLGYDSNPDKLQTVMRQVYSWGVSQLSIPGVTVVPLPLYEVLDGKDTNDYVARVEPSEAGGQKMGKAIAEAICRALDE